MEERRGGEVRESWYKGNGSRGQKEKEEREENWTNKPLTDLAQNGHELSHSVLVLCGDHVEEKVLPSLKVYDKGLVVRRTDADSFDRG